MKIRISEGSGQRLKIKSFNISEEPKAEDMALSKRRLDYLTPSTMSEVVSLLKKYLRRDIPVMIIGSSGFGKSQLIKQAAKDIPGYPVAEVLDIRAGMLNVEDLRGLPMLVKDAENIERAFTQSTIPSWLKKVILNTDKNYVLFFDELNHASAAVLNSVYGIILERTLEDFDFNDRTRIVAAGNKSEQNEDLTELSDPLMRRLEIIDIDKAIDINKDFFEDYLIKKYSNSIPKEILDIVFDPNTETADARSVERVLKAWAEDIAEGDPTLTRSGAIPPDMFARIQKIYSSKYVKTSGSERHKEVIDKVVAFTERLKTERPEFFISNEMMYNIGDLAEGNIKGTPYSGESLSLSEEGKQFIISQFKDEPEEFVAAALNKTNN